MALGVLREEFQPTFPQHRAQVVMEKSIDGDAIFLVGDQGVNSFIRLSCPFGMELGRLDRKNVIHISTGQDEHFPRMAARPGHDNGSSI
jgi:hypothetical protein